MKDIRISVRLDEEDYQALNRIAQKLNITTSLLTRTAIKRFVQVNKDD